MRLADVWRDRNDKVKQFTFHRHKPSYIGSRIDYFLIELGISSWCTDTKIIPGFRTDHSAILLELNVHHVNVGPGLRKMNKPDPF